MDSISVFLFANRDFTLAFAFWVSRLCGDYGTPGCWYRYGLLFRQGAPVRRLEPTIVFLLLRFGIEFLEFKNLKPLF